MIKSFFRYSKRFFRNKVFKLILMLLLCLILSILNNKLVHASSVGASSVSWSVNFDQCKNNNGMVNCVPFVTRGSDDSTNFNMSSNRLSYSDLSSYSENLISGWYNMGDSVAIRSMVFTYNNAQVTTGSSRKQIRLQIPFITNYTDYITSSSSYSATQNINKSKEYFPGLPFYSFNYQENNDWVRGSALHMKPYAIKVYQKLSGESNFSWVDYTQYNQVYWGSTTYQYGVAITLPTNAEITKVRVYVGSPTHFKGSYTDFQNKWATDDYSKLTSNSSIFSNTISDYIAYCNSSTCKFMPSYQTVYMDLSPSSTISDRMVFMSTLEQIDEQVQANAEIENINYQNAQIIGQTISDIDLEQLIEDSKDFVDSYTDSYNDNFSDMFSYLFTKLNQVKDIDIYTSNNEVNYNMCMRSNQGGANNNYNVPLMKDQVNSNHTWSLDLPCMPEIYKNIDNNNPNLHLLSMLRIIIHFVFAWWFANNLIAMIKSSIEPQDTEIEVLDL